MAALPDVWVDLPGMEGGPDRVSIDQLGLAIPAGRLPPAAWRAVAVQALRVWFHEIPARSWAGATIERTDRSTATAPEVIVHHADQATVLGRISPRQVDDGATAARGRQG